MMAAIIQKYLQQYSIAQIMQVIDAGVVLVGMYVFGIHKALYAIIAVYLVTKVSDGLIEGLKDVYKRQVLLTVFTILSLIRILRKIMEHWNRLWQSPWKN